MEVIERSALSDTAWVYTNPIILEAVWLFKVVCYDQIELIWIGLQGSVVKYSRIVFRGVGSLKLPMVGIFTPGKLANGTNQMVVFVFLFDRAYKHINAFTYKKKKWEWFWSSILYKFCTSAQGEYTFF